MIPDAHSEPTHRSAVAEQLRLGFPWLRFERSLEREFQRELYENNVVQLRLNLALGLGLVLAFVAMDRSVLPSTTALVAWLRFGVVLPSLLVCLGVTFIPHSSRLYQWAAAFAAPLLLVAATVLVLRAGEVGSERIFPVLVLAVVFVYYLAGLTFYAAVRTNLIGMAAFVIGVSIANIPAEQSAYQTMVLFFSSLVGAAVAYSLEMARRTGWLEARLLSELAERDGLTGTYNRRRLDGYLRRAWQQGVREQCPMALLMIDIDFFKAYNDRYGHQAGDEALKSVAAVLARAARRPLDFVARYGGEEFLVVLYDTSREHAAQLGRQVLEGVRDLHIPHNASPIASVLTVSVGIAHVMPTGRRSPDGLIQLADEALYGAKHGGRNRVHALEAEYEQMRTGKFRLTPRG